MKLVPVNSIPEVKTHKKHDAISAAIEDFVFSGNTMVKVEPEEGSYSRPDSCKNALWQIIHKNGYNIKIVQRGEDIYLVKVK